MKRLLSLTLKPPKFPGQPSLSTWVCAWFLGVWLVLDAWFTSYLFVLLLRCCLSTLQAWGPPTRVRSRSWASGESWNYVGGIGGLSREFRWVGFSTACFPDTNTIFLNTTNNARVCLCLYVWCRFMLRKSSLLRRNVKEKTPRKSFCDFNANITTVAVTTT